MSRVDSNFVVEVLVPEGTKLPIGTVSAPVEGGRLVAVFALADGEEGAKRATLSRYPGAQVMSVRSLVKPTPRDLWEERQARQPVVG